MKSPPNISQAERFVRTRARLMGFLHTRLHLLSPRDQEFAGMLYIKHDMHRHPYGPGKELCDWYLGLIDGFLEYAEREIEKGLEPYQDYANKKKRRQLVHAESNMVKS